MLDEKDAKLRELGFELRNKSKEIQERDNQIAEQIKKFEELQTKALGKILKLFQLNIVINRTKVFKSLIYQDKARNCKEIKYFMPSSESGVHEIEVEVEKIQVRCEMIGKPDGLSVLLAPLLIFFFLKL